VTNQPGREIGSLTVWVGDLGKREEEKEMKYYGGGLGGRVTREGEGEPGVLFYFLGETRGQWGEETT